MTYKEFVKAWKKVISSTKRFIRGAEQRGYKFDWVEPEMPKHVSPRKLEDLKWETSRPRMYSKAEYVEKSTGEVLSGYQGQKRERQKSAEKGKRTRRKHKYEESIKDIPTISSIAYNNLRQSLEQMSSYSNIKARGHRATSVIADKQQYASDLLSLLDKVIAEEGEREVFTRLEEDSLRIQSAIADMWMSSTQEEVRKSAVELATIINGGSLTANQNIGYTEMEEQIQGVNPV